MTSRRYRALLTLLLLPAVAACGSTVQLHGVVSQAGASQQGLAVGGPDGSAPLTGGAVSTGQPTGVAPGSQPSTVGGVTNPTASGTTGAAVPGQVAVGASASGRGYDAKHVYLGLPVQTDVNAGAAALGFTNVDFGDQVAQINAIVKDINAHGGVAGRTLVAVLKDVKTADLEANAEQQGNVVCTYFTQDHPVVAVVNLLSAIDRPSFYGCLQHHNMPVVSAGLAPVDDQFLAQFRQILYKSCCISMDALTPVLLDRLKALGYFTSWDTTNGAPGTAPVRLALLYGPDPSPRIMAKMKARLVAMHYTVASEFQYGSVSDMSSAVLKFRSAGVTHVLADNGDLYFFMQEAESQHYRPRYEVNSYMGTNVALIGLGAPAAQMKGSLGVGWIPVDDVADAQDPGAISAAETHCHDIMLRAGQQDISKRSVKHQAYTFCDSIHLVTDAMSAVNGFDPAALQRGTVALGARFGSALTFRAGLSLSRPYIPGAVRDLGFDAGCSCYTYLSSSLHAV